MEQAPAFRARPGNINPPQPRRRVCRPIRAIRPRVWAMSPSSRVLRGRINRPPALAGADWPIPGSSAGVQPIPPSGGAVPGPTSRLPERRPASSLRSVTSRPVAPALDRHRARSVRSSRRGARRVALRRIRGCLSQGPEVLSSSSVPLEPFSPSRVSKRVSGPIVGALSIPAVPSARSNAPPGPSSWTRAPHNASLPRQGTSWRGWARFSKAPVALVNISRVRLRSNVCWPILGTSSVRLRHPCNPNVRVVPTSRTWDRLRACRRVLAISSPIRHPFPTSRVRQGPFNRIPEWLNVMMPGPADSLPGRPQSPSSAVLPAAISPGLDQPPV